MNLPAPTSTPSSLQLLQQMQALLVERDQKIASLEYQLAWFKQQLFGEKSEKRLIENPDQLSLGNILQDKPEEQAVPTETITYERRKKNRPEGEKGHPLFKKQIFGCSLFCFRSFQRHDLRTLFHGLPRPQAYD